MIFSKWKLADAWEQPLHALAGFLITLIPLLVVRYFIDINLLFMIIVANVSYILSILIGALREYRQHKRFVYNLDMFFWSVGSTIGVPIQWLFMLIF